MKQIIEEKQFDEERALYHLEDTCVQSCVFAGLMDGESVLKEARNTEVADCQFSLRYPMWHVKGFSMSGSTMEDTDLAFEYSDVDADVRGSVVSIKNLKSGKIIVDSVREIIREDPVMECIGEVICRNI